MKRLLLTTALCLVAVSASAQLRRSTPEPAVTDTPPPASPAPAAGPATQTPSAPTVEVPAIPVTPPPAAGAPASPQGGSAGTGASRPAQRQAARPAPKLRAVTGMAQALDASSFAVRDADQKSVVVKLAGVTAVTANLSALDRTLGSPIDCKEIQANAWTCVTARGDDLATLVVASGMARAATGASADIAAAERQAQRLKAGVWK